MLVLATVISTSVPAVVYAAPAPGDMYECLNHTHVWDKRQCPEFKTGGPAGFPGAGGGGRGGILGAIGDLVGGLTGGLL